MKKIFLTLFCLFFVSYTYGLEVIMYKDANFTPCYNSSELDIFESSLPQKPFREIGKLIYNNAFGINEKKALKKIKEKAKEIGADGLIIQGCKNSNYYAINCNSLSIIDEEKKDYTAIMIKYN